MDFSRKYCTFQVEDITFLLLDNRLILPYFPWNLPLSLNKHPGISKIFHQLCPPSLCISIDLLLPGTQMDILNRGNLDLSPRCERHLNPCGFPTATVSVSNSKLAKILSNSLSSEKSAASVTTIYSD